MKRLLIDNSSLTKRLLIKGFITVLSTKLDLIKQSEHSPKKYTLVRKVSLQTNVYFGEVLELFN